MADNISGGMVLDIFDSGFAADPWPTLDRLRRAGGVHRVRTPDGPPAWLVTGYADVRAVLLDTRLTTGTHYANGRDYRGHTMYPGAHARLRQVLATESTPRTTDEWTRRAPELVEALLKDLDPATIVDLVERLAVPLPAAVLGELLGLPAADREAVLAWANSTLLSAAGRPAAQALDTLQAMHAIITGAIDRTRGTDTVLGRLVAAHEGGSIDAEELQAGFRYLLFFWYQVLTDLVTGAILTLLTHHDQVPLLRTAPDRAVDELLRYLSPQVLASPRFATTDLPLGDYTIRAGQTVLCCLAGANHDPAAFHAPGTLDLAREPNQHLSLGHGPHSCLGTGLIRAVTATTLHHVCTRWPAMTSTMEPSEIQWRSGFRHRGPLALPVRLA
ncbi:cytochrome P450 [Nocardia goodfellowii]|uniref:Cytochrome P450 n=1 Tax=Nocardia goodfellowii TaxID=882446 RepID=A0ABS4QRV8_9NOCA|nr:cytochrome P450 [Nocardia goodfellowii]MBP2194444.1 cytochrome P450 [Nocardia goodfellowii]